MSIRILLAFLLTGCSVEINETGQPVPQLIEDDFCFEGTCEDLPWVPDGAWIHSSNTHYCRGDEAIMFICELDQQLEVQFSWNEQWSYQQDMPGCQEHADLLEGRLSINPDWDQLTECEM